MKLAQLFHSSKCENIIKNRAIFGAVFILN